MGGGLTRNHSSSVCLIANYYEREVTWVCWSCLLEEVLFPKVEAVERGLIAHVEDKHAAVGATVKGKADGLVPFLPCRVPGLDGDKIISNCDLLSLEIRANGCLSVR